MKIHRFFCVDRLGTPGSMQVNLVPSNPIFKQMQNVLRLSVGENIILFDNSGKDFLCNIIENKKDKIILEIVEIKNNIVMPTHEVYLFASVVKKDNFEWIVEKATELGVSCIVPILSERSEKKNLNMDRLNKIIIEASEQSGRGMLPALQEIINLETALEKYKDIKSIAWHIDAPKVVSQDISNNNSNNDSSLTKTLGAYIGPEGGWSPSELALFVKHEIPVRSLVTQTLRSETAVVAILAKYLT